MQQRRQELTEAFKACIAAPLRFQLGAAVQANVGAPEGDGFANGTIIAQWDECRAYRIRLHTGDEVHAPCDDDRFVRAASGFEGTWRTSSGSTQVIKVGGSAFTALSESSIE